MDTRFVMVLCALVALAAQPAPAGDAARAGAILQELPTLKCLGVRWLVAGDDNGNAGKAPDLGAYEQGRPFPHYGPRPDKSK